MKRAVLPLVILLCAWTAWPRAIQVSLDTGALQQAIAIGQSRLTGEQDRFHAPYRLTIAKAPVDYIDVITPFRRIVLAAQAQGEIGDRNFGQRDALKTLDAAADILEFDVEFTFHPLNTYIGVPDYRVVLVPPAAGAGSRGPALQIQPESLDRIPRFGPRVAGLPLPHPRPGGIAPAQRRRSEPMLGGTVVAQYDIKTLDANASYVLVISEMGNELARARVDLAGLR